MTTAAPISDRFTVLYQEMEPDTGIGPDSFTQALDQIGIDAIISASGGAIHTATIDGREMRFMAYAYLSAAGALNVWMEALSLDMPAPKPLAVARLSWSHDHSGTDEAHEQLAERVRRAYSDHS